MVRFIRANASPTRAVQSSGSNRSAIEVEPAMSAKSTVSGRRSLDPVGRAVAGASEALMARIMLVTRPLAPRRIWFKPPGGELAFSRARRDLRPQRSWREAIPLHPGRPPRPRGDPGVGDPAAKAADPGPFRGPLHQDPGHVSDRRSRRPPS